MSQCVLLEHVECLFPHANGIADTANIEQHACATTNTNFLVKLHHLARPDF